MQVLRGIGKQYPNLFERGSEGGTGESGGGFWEKYGIIAIINQMANNDRSKWDYYFDMNVIEFLNTIAFHKDRAEQERIELERIKNGKV